MGVVEAIREADALLPGEPVDEGQDPRWQAIITVGEHVESEPEAVWSFIRRWGGHPQSYRPEPDNGVSPRPVPRYLSDACVASWIA
jgi:hypothetical protein